MTPGSILIQLAALLAVVAFVASIRWARGRAASERTFRWAYHGMTACLGLASVILMRAILAHDFRFEYVIGYSSRDLPLVYLISAFWAGQEGTFLLWGLTGALLGYALFHRRAWEPAAVMAAYVPTVGFLIGLMLDPGGNPFRLAPQVPADGRGLNPLLQDPWMASHPPAVFVGYAALTVPAILALVAILRNREEKWLEPALRWSLGGFVLLGIGIVLGGFWAYKVLGWGGYWGWDPVENASLIPWIAVAALIHGLLVQKFTGALRRTNLVLALSCYLLVLYSTFLTRSGVLADFSVHSFPEGTIYRELVAILAITDGVGAAALLWRRGRDNGPSVPFSLSWTLVLSAAILLLVLSGALVLLATSWPIISSMAGTPTTIETSFYNRANLPFYLAVFALLSIAPFLSWRGARSGWWKMLLGPLAFALLVSGAAVSVGIPVDLSLALFFLAAVALGSAVVRFVQVGRQRLLNTGAAVAHAGFALMFMAFVASSVWDRTEEVALPLNQPVPALGVTLVYGGHVAGSEPEHRWAVTVVDEDGKRRSREMTLHRMQGEEQQLMRKPAIFRELFRDVYLIPAAVQPSERETHSLELAKEQAADLHGTTITFKSFAMGQASEEHGAMAIAVVEVDNEGRSETLSLPFGVVDGRLQGRPVELSVRPGTRLTVTGMSVEQGMVGVQAEEVTAGARPETLSVQAESKPLMSFLWLGTLLLGVGCTVAVVRRVADARAAAEAREHRLRLAKAKPAAA